VQDQCAQLVRKPGELLSLEKGLHNHHLKGSLMKDLSSQQTTLGLILTKSLVGQLLPGGPAHLAGLEKGDTILEVRGH